MMQHKKMLAVAMVLFSTPFIAQSASTSVSVLPASAKEGQRLHHYLYCSSCHGETGASPSRNWPSLTGQKADYTIKTLLDYRDNHRRDNYRKADLMHRVSTLLTDQNIVDLAAFYASSPLPQKPEGINMELAKKGERIAQKGDKSLGIDSCASCHGKEGTSGTTPKTPALAGQTPEYFIQAMKMYQEDMRSSDAGEEMRSISKLLSSDKIKALAHYYASLGYENK